MAFRDAAKVVASNCEEEGTCGELWEQQSTILLAIVHVVIVEDDGGDDVGGGDGVVDDEENDGTYVVDACGLDVAKGSERNRCSLGSCRVEGVLPGALVAEAPFVLEAESIFLLGLVLLGVGISWNVEWLEMA